MALSRKNYKEIAKIINKAVNDMEKFCDQHNVNSEAGSRFTVYIAVDFAKYFKNDNPNFDVAKFYEACFGTIQEMHYE